MPALAFSVGSCNPTRPYESGSESPTRRKVPEQGHTFGLRWKTVGEINAIAYSLALSNEPRACLSTRGDHLISFWMDRVCGKRKRFLDSLVLNGGTIHIFRRRYSFSSKGAAGCFHHFGEEREANCEQPVNNYLCKWHQFRSMQE